MKQQDSKGTWEWEDWRGDGEGEGGRGRGRWEGKMEKGEGGRGRGRWEGGGGEVGKEITRRGEGRVGEG
jgi:hypothetical protein